MIGNIGNVTFEVSENNVRTFNDLAANHSASFAEHKILNKKSLLEFTGLNPSTCSLKISLNAALGINPLHEINTLYDILNNHEPVSFMLGDKVQGAGLWVIESLNVAYDIVGSHGEIFSATVSVALKEFAS